jgi:uroporphyrinogen-III decarboxylase
MRSVRSAGDGYQRGWARLDDRCGSCAGASASAMVTQGNIDPLLMTAGPEALDAAVDAMLDGAQGVPHVANLGHGITPDGQIDQVHRFIERVRSGRKS